MGRVNGGVPRRGGIRQKNPGRQSESLLLAHPRQKNVAQRSLSSVAALPPRRALGGAARTRAAGRAAGPDCGPCATGIEQFQGYEDVAAIGERAPQF